MSHTTWVGDAPPAPSGSSQKVPSRTAPALRCDANSVKHVLAADDELIPLSSVGELVGPADGDEVRIVGKLLQARQITAKVAVATSLVRQNGHVVFGRHRSFVARLGDSLPTHLGDTNGLRSTAHKPHANARTLHLQ